MLFLQLPAATADFGTTAAVPMSDAAALALERALLSLDTETRCDELRGAFDADPNIAGWALRIAEARLGRTINRAEEAATWLGANLVCELAGSLRDDSETTSLCSIPLPGPPPKGEGEEAEDTDESTLTANREICWRLPRLVAVLHAAEQRVAEFDRRLEHEKLESLKELAYGASHEINNPLANIAARAQTLLEDESDPERQRKLLAIHRQAMRAHEMIADLMLVARPPKLVRESFSLSELVANVVGEWQERAAKEAIELKYIAADKVVEVMADPTQLAVAIGTLIRNACEAVGDGGNVCVTVRQVSMNGLDRAEIVVRDDGPGISDEVRQHMFDPFFSGREAGRGLGFGLSKCWRIVTDHGGDVVVENRTGGVEIAIRLPAAERV